ncbi:MAG: hypothetical protein ACRBBK_12540 [Paracoccaceae bacterium]
MIADEIAIELARMEAERVKVANPPKVKPERLVYGGAHLHKDDKPLVDVWKVLHENYLTWLKIPPGPLQTEDRLRFDASDAKLFKSLQDTSASQWMALCQGIGWTTVGAIAVSWCKDASVEDVWAAWTASNSVFVPTVEQRRPAWFLNPNVGPQTNSLQMITSFANGQGTAICILISALRGPLLLDMEYEDLKGAPANIASFLKAACLEKPMATDQETLLLGVWSERVAGTPYDIWEK